MRQLSATEAAREFSELLDAVEHRHESFVIRRGGKAVARIGPAATGNGRELKKLLRSYTPDPAWPEELSALRKDLQGQERSWPG